MMLQIYDLQHFFLFAIPFYLQAFPFYLQAFLGLLERAPHSWVKLSKVHLHLVDLAVWKFVFSLQLN